MPGGTDTAEMESIKPRCAEERRMTGKGEKEEELWKVGGALSAQAVRKLLRGKGKTLVSREVPGK